MADWATISSLATAGGTLVLAAATFASVRSRNRAARATGRALLAGIRPVLVPSRMQDPPEKVGFVDDHWVKVGGGHAIAEVTDEAIYLAMALRNAGSGLAVLDRWDFYADRATSDLPHPLPKGVPTIDSRHLRTCRRSRFLAGHHPIRGQTDPKFAAARDAIRERRSITVDLLYGDHEGGQRTISRFSLIPRGEEEWLTAVSRH